MQDVEKELGWYTGKLGRVESGTRGIVRTEVDRLADLYEIGGDTRATLHLLADAARKREPTPRVADFAQTYITLLRDADRVDYHDAVLVPGLVQTPEYARAILTASRSTNVEERVAERIERQEILRRPKPPVLRLLLGQAVLYQEVGGPEVLRGQLRHLVGLAESVESVSVRIMPFSAGAYRGLGVGFTYIEIDSPAIRRVYIEGYTHATYIHEPDETSVYASEFERLWSSALDDRESASILRRRIDDSEEL